MTQIWDKEVDALVVGSGAGGLLTALVAADNHADVLVIEKEAQWGGTSATSGAGIWIPNSDQARAAGFEVSVVEDACRGIDLNGSLEAAWKSMAEKGVKRIQSDDIQVG